jgi:hypothetical protein
MTTAHHSVKRLHQSYFRSAFESIPIRRLGLFHVLQGLSAGRFGRWIAEQGSWRGILSTDGRRVVVTVIEPDTPLADASTYVFDNECVEQCFDKVDSWHRSRCAYIVFSQSMPGLTLTRRETWTCVLTSVVGLGFVQAFLCSRCFYFLPEPHFGSLSTVSRLLVGSR